MWSITRPAPIHVDSPEKVARLKEKLENTCIAAYDTETTGLEYDAEILFWSISTGADRYFLERKYLNEFEGVFADPSRIWLATNAKFDGHMMANAGVNIAGAWACTVVMDHLLDTDRPHGLKDVYAREFNEFTLSFEETFFQGSAKGKKKDVGGTLLRCWSEDPDKVIRYASLDAWMTYRIYERLEGKLKAMTAWNGKSGWDIFATQEMPFTKVLFAMERHGILVDTEYLKSLLPSMERDMEQISRTLAHRAGQVINPQSTKQVSELIFHVLKYPIRSYTKGGAPSVDEKTLTAIANGGCEEAQLILKYRAISKTRGTYVNGLLSRVGRDGRIHTEYNQSGTMTGRLSSNHPNLQNIPRADKDPYHIRKAFIAPPGKVYLAADYEQLEMYIAAHYSQDPTLLNAIREKRDLHASTAAQIWGVPYEEIIRAKKLDKTKGPISPRDQELLDMRQGAKTINFGLIYGQQEAHFAEQLGLIDKVREENPKLSPKAVIQEARNQARKMIDLYFQKIPGVAAYIRDIHERTANQGYVETWSGRRRWLRYILSAAEMLEHEKAAKVDAIRQGKSPAKATCWCDFCRESRKGERQASNTPIQGTAADIVQLAMIKIANDRACDSITMVLQVHDELGIEVPVELVDEADALIRMHMENPGFTDFRVPLRASTGVGANWAEAK